MTLQNRVDPWGALHAVPERGTMLGNRGGKFHRDDRTLGKRRWATHHWICCELHYKDMHHEAMGRGYTSLFFLDEVTALAAGHRPCFFCRRAEAKLFMALAETTTDAFDSKLHAERIPPRVAGRVVSAANRVGSVPEGAMVEIEGAAYAVKGSQLLRWSFSGYTGVLFRNASMRGRLLTPPSIAAILRAGYEPRWHSSAQTWGGT